MFQEFWNVHRTCLLAVPLLFFLHRHDDVTPSLFRALESHVLRVPNGNGMKKWSSPSSLSSPSVLVWFLAASRKQHSCLHLYCATTLVAEHSRTVLGNVPRGLVIAKLEKCRLKKTMISESLWVEPKVFLCLHKPSFRHNFAAWTLHC